MFLFNNERNARTENRLGTLAHPVVEWCTHLRQFPARGPESTAVLDDEGNVYFGCHDNCFYSLDSKGTIRWQFQTGDKIYSSPLLLNNRLYVSVNKGDILCLSLTGELVWSFEGFKHWSKQARWKRVAANIFSYIYYDYELKQYMKLNAWPSVNTIAKDVIVTVVYGLGVLALDAATGQQLWSFNMGFPCYHLAGVATTRFDNEWNVFAVSQSGALFCIDGNGRLLWRRALKQGHNSWGNPSIDSENRSVYCSTSKRNESSVVYKFELSGRPVWKTNVDAGIRGSISITTGSEVLVPTMKGQLLFLNKESGMIVRRLDLASRERGLWTTAAIDGGGDILLNTKNDSASGSLLRLNPTGVVKWRLDYGKALSVPVVDANGGIYTGTWDGKFIKLQS